MGLKKTAHIQLNIATGLGDLLADFLSCIDAAKFLKSLNYYVTFAYSLHGNIYPEGPNILEKVFHTSMFNIFDKISEINIPTTSLNIDNMKFFKGEHIHAVPGAHHIDLYLSSIPENFALRPYSAEAKIRTNINYNERVLFTENIENKLFNFRKTLPEEYVFLHIRRSTNNNIDTLASSIKKFVASNYPNTNIHVGSDQILMVDELKNENHFFAYSFSDEYNHLSNNTQCIKFIDTFAEMASIRHAKKILAYNEYGWVSNFLFYAILQGVEYNQINVSLY